MASRLGLGGALAVSMLAAALAHAEPTAVDRETARTMMDQGRDLERKGDLKEALKRFRAADDIMHVPTTALAVAETQTALGLLVEARDTLASSMRRTPERPTDPQPFKDARAEGDKLDASLAGRVPGLTITVKGAAPGEQPALAIDGLEVPVAAIGLPREVDPGHHVVVAKTATSEGRQEVDIREGEQKQVELTLVSSGRPAAEPPGEPPPAPTLAAPTTSHGPDAVTWIGVGLAGAGVVVGSVSGVMALSKGSGLAGECANHVCGPAGRSDLSSAYATATVSDAAFAVAGVGAVVAVVSLVVAHESSAQVPAEPQPVTPGPTAYLWVGFGSGGLRGTF